MTGPDLGMLVLAAAGLIALIHHVSGADTFDQWWRRRRDERRNSPGS